jgi:hypothetical protein
MSIKISVTNKQAQLIGAHSIVCGNSGYIIDFTFDAEWTPKAAKTVRFVYVKNGVVTYTDVVMTDDTVEVPILSNIQKVRVGVFEGNLRTTTPAVIPCERSIRCGTGAPADPTPSQYDQIMELLSNVPYCIDLTANGDLYETSVTVAELEDAMANGRLIIAKCPYPTPDAAMELQMPLSAVITTDGGLQFVFMTGSLMLVLDPNGVGYSVVTIS